ncbi:MAG TPA: Hsp20/alpha crystallin family protein [Spirochaetia bacterium]|nr:Hsp20/alpha crystallin family protein [Spirochaetia bacterium]
MYVSTFNPNQAVAFSQGYQTGATTAIPLQVRPSWSGNTVIYGFNPVASQTQAWNLSQAVNSASLNPALGLAANQAILANPVLTQGAVNPLTTSGINAWGTPVTTANAALAQQAFANPFINSGINAWGVPVTTNAALAQQAFANPFINSGINTWGVPVTTNAVLAQQAFANPFIASGMVNLNAIAGTTGLAQMRVDLAETNSDVVLAAELPNVSLNDLSLTVTDDSMSISATAYAGNRATSLYRTIALPTTIKSEQVEATYANGILEIRCPKSDLVSRRKVKVTVAQ